MAEQSASELARRHRAAATFVSALITLALALIASAYAGLRPPLRVGFINQTIYFALSIVILFAGLGAIALRRMRFGALRLQAVAEAKGTSALIATLYKTTVLVASFSIVIALIGYVQFMRSLEPWDMLKAGVIAIAILLYAYPRRAAWQRTLEAVETPGGLAEEAPTAKGTPA